MSKRGIKGTAMTFPQKENFMKRLVDFELAARKLLDAWEDGSEFPEDYPFRESFDETVLNITQWQASCAQHMNRLQAILAETPAVVTLDTTQMDGEFEKDLRQRGITHKVLAQIWNGWSVEYRGSRLALQKLVAEWWGDEEGSMGEQEKIQDVTPEPAKFEDIAKLLHAIHPEAESINTGGGIYCIRLLVGHHAFYFGTANENWGASVYTILSDGNERWIEDGGYDPNIIVDLSSDEPDAAKVAAAINACTDAFYSKYYVTQK